MLKIMKKKLVDTSMEMEGMAKKERETENTGMALILEKSWCTKSFTQSSSVSVPFLILLHIFASGLFLLLTLVTIIFKYQPTLEI